jgi:hypothetical protein
MFSCQSLHNLNNHEIFPDAVEEQVNDYDLLDAEGDEDILYDIIDAEQKEVQPDATPTSSSQNASKNEAFKKLLADHIGSAAYKALQPVIKKFLWAELRKVLCGTGMVALTEDGQEWPVVSDSLRGIMDLILMKLGAGNILRAGVDVATFSISSEEIQKYHPVAVNIYSSQEEDYVAVEAVEELTHRVDILTGAVAGGLGTVVSTGASLVGSTIKKVGSWFGW